MTPRCPTHAKRKVALDATIRIDAYSIVDDAVEAAVRYGYRRAHKHTDKPDEEAITDAIHRAVMDELSAVIRWREDDA